MAAASVSPFRTAQLVKFSLVGLTGAAIQLALIWSFHTLVGLSYLLGIVVAIEITLLYQYVVNNAWTFHRSRHDSLREYVVGMGKTNLVRGTAIPLQLAIVVCLVRWANLGWLVANGFAIGPAGIYRYLLDAHWTWG